jgi:hypothetical protein
VNMPLRLPVSPGPFRDDRRQPSRFIFDGTLLRETAPRPLTQSLALRYRRGQARGSSTVAGESRLSPSLLIFGALTAGR